MSPDELSTLATRVALLAAGATAALASRDPEAADEKLVKAANVLAAAGFCMKTRDVRVIRG